MTVVMSRNYITFISCLLILLGFSLTASAFQEKTITASENVYKKVVGGGTQGTNFVILKDLVNWDKFTPDDTVLLIQMKGVYSRVDEGPFYGDAIDTVGTPGGYEFLIILDTVKLERKIVFANPIANSYDAKGDLQLIRIPQYYSVNIGANITCPPWDSLSGTGGVMAMIVGGTLRLSANIDVSAKGFLGAKIADGDGICSFTDPALYQKYGYNESFSNSGYKGEGIISKGTTDFTTYGSVFPYFSKGKGSNFNGGAGGNGKYFGGAGGSNIGTGGRGGKESGDCGSSDSPAQRYSITGYFFDTGGLFLGGGGGGSTKTGAGTGIKGGNGGGIIIILANEIQGNGFSINANGESPSGSTSGNAGAGGGGAGGSIALYLESFASLASTDLYVNANGGKGGDSGTGTGEGGGGGAGLIWTNIPATGKATLKSAKGLKGFASTQTATDGTDATPTTAAKYIPKLNGFLFNSIRSSVTNNLVDSVCSNTIPSIIIGTNPVGGSGSYTYKWQRRIYPKGPPSLIAGSNVKDFTFTATETDTFEIRRIVVDNVTALTDTSLWLTIIVQPEIQNNLVNIQSTIVSVTDTICWNQDPKLIDQGVPALIPPTTKHLFYAWRDSSAGKTWGAAIAGATAKSYDPPAGLKKSTAYKRIVTSGRCIDSTAIARFTVLDTINKNLIVTRFDTICHGGTFVDLTGDPSLGGGDNTYRYLWQYSTTGANGSWSTATGISTNSSYNPDEASAMYPGKVYYRRKVFSGAHNVCVDSSKAAIRVDWPSITANNIAADEIICSGNQPVAVTGPEPLNGAGPGTFKYTYQDSSKSHNWTDIAGYVKVLGLGYAPPVLTDTTAIRRIAYSSKCVDISKRVVKMVHKPITNFNVLLFSGTWDTTLCSPADPEKLNGLTPGPTSGTGNPANNIYQWSTSATKTGGYSDISGATSEDFDPSTLTNASPAIPAYFFYRRKVTNGACSAISDSAVKITVLPKISNNIITADPATCYNIAPNPLTGTALTGGDGTPKWQWQQSVNAGVTWTNISGATSQNYSAPPLTAPTDYRRLVFSGNLDCCKDTSDAKSVAINPLPVGNIAAAIDTICEGTPGKVFNLAITGSTASPWTVVYRENATDKPSTVVNTPTSTVALNPVIPGASTDSTSFTYKLVSIKDANNCDAVTAGMTGSRKLVVWKVPVVDAGTAADNCGPVYLLTGTKNVGTGTWTYPGVPVLNSSASGNNLTVTVDLPYVASWFHKYRFFYTSRNWTCQAKDSVDITFYLEPDSAMAGEDVTIYSLDNEVVLPYVTPTVGTGTWTALSGGASQKDDSTFTDLSVGDNTFEWKIINTITTCFSADQVVYTVENVLIPDAFSPNGDGINDKFEILGLDLANSRVTLTILNSAGSEIYRTTNINDTYVAWTGENNGNAVPDGTYYYLLTMESTKSGNNTLKNWSGFVILKRDKIQ